MNQLRPSYVPIRSRARAAEDAAALGEPAHTLEASRAVIDVAEFLAQLCNATVRLLRDLLWSSSGQDVWLDNNKSCAIVAQCDESTIRPSVPSPVLTVGGWGLSGPETAHRPGYVMVSRDQSLQLVSKVVGPLPLLSFLER